MKRPYSIFCTYARTYDFSSFSALLKGKLRPFADRSFAYSRIAEVSA
jgi:hypothetical protein